MTPLPPQHLDILTMAETQRRTPTKRTIGLAMALTALFAWLIPHNDLLLRNTPLAGNLLPTDTVLVLLIFAAIAFKEPPHRNGIGADHPIRSMGPQQSVPAIGR